jgi:hypothetical protein
VTCWVGVTVAVVTTEGSTDTAPLDVAVAKMATVPASAAMAPRTVGCFMIGFPLRNVPALPACIDAPSARATRFTMGRANHFPRRVVNI